MSAFVELYPWANAPKEYRRRFVGTRRTWIAYVPAGKELGPKHFVNRLDDPVTKSRRDGSTLVAGNEGG